MRALLDTCVIIDALQNREPFSKDAQSIFLEAANKRFDGFISAKSIADIYYLIHKSTHSDETSRNIISKLFELFDVLDTKGLDCKKALLSSISDYEDAIMIETASREGIDYIITRDIKDYSQSSIKVLAPNDFVGLFRNT